MTVREIIIQALNRSNVVSKKQPAPGDRLETGLELLQGVVSQYNNDNYLAFTQMGVSLPARKVIHIYGDIDTMLPENDRVFRNMTALNEYEITEEDFENHVWGFVNDGLHDGSVFSIIDIHVPGGVKYQWVEQPDVDQFSPRYQEIYRYAKAYHAHIDGVSKLNTLNIDRGGQYGMIKINFVPRSEFDSFANGDLLWTFTEGAEGEYIIELKPYIAQQALKLKLDYNRAIKFDLDTDLRIPDAYRELLIVSLAYKLAVKYPRLDDAQMQRLENEVGVMLSNVRTPKADQRQVLRDDGVANDRGSYWGVVGGRMWGL